MSENTHRSTLARFVPANREHPFVLLLSLLFLLLFTTPLLQLLDVNSYVIRTTLLVLFMFLLISAVLTVCDTRQRKYTALALAGPAVLLHAVAFLVQVDAVVAIDQTLSAVFLGYVVALILKSIFDRDHVDINVISAALCVYLLLGTLWANLYSLVDIAEDGAFYYSLAEEGERRVMRFGGEYSVTPLYYSFVTMTTLGYGDVIPNKPSAKMLAMLEALIGQLYLAVLLARLVGIQISQSSSPSRSQGESAHTHAEADPRRDEDESD